jgi:GntR family transcriptional regulator/MocR family aminotransferase
VLGFALVRDDDIPLYRQVYEHISTAIKTGQLRPGDRLPSARSLAEQFGTARSTAYAILAGVHGAALSSARRLSGKASFGPRL